LSRVVITGGAGFIGSRAVVKFLEQDYSVDVVDDFSTGDMESLPAHPRLRVFRHDVSVEEGLEEFVNGADAVVHLAAVSSVPACEKDVKRAFEVNVRGVENLAKACSRAGVERIVFSSTAAVYACGNLLSETSPTNPVSVYGNTKLVAEEMLRCLSEQENLCTTVLRIFNVYGRVRPGRGVYGVVDQFIADALSKGCLKVFGDGSQVRDFIHVDDVAEAVFRAVVNAAGGHQVFNIGSGQGISVADLALLIQASIPARKIEVINLPARPADIRYSVADVSKAFKHLGFKPRFNLKTYIEQRTRGW